MIGGLSRTATGALRQLIDAGTLANLPAGFKARGLRIRDDETPLEPGEFRDVDAPGGALRDSLIPLPYKEPSATLLQLLGFCVEAGQRFASITNLQMGEGNQDASRHDYGFARARYKSHVRSTQKITLRTENRV